MEGQEDLRAKPLLYFMNRTKNESMTQGPEAELPNYLVTEFMADRYLFCSRSGQKTELRTFFFSSFFSSNGVTLSLLFI